MREFPRTFCKKKKIALKRFLSSIDENSKKNFKKRGEKNVFSYKRKYGMATSLQALRRKMFLLDGWRYSVKMFVRTPVAD